MLIRKMFRYENRNDYTVVVPIMNTGRAVLSNAPAGPGPPKPQGGPNS